MKQAWGDLVQMVVDGEFDVIIHGCNCHNTMGAGIAAQIARKIPEARMADDLYVTRTAVDKLSSFSVAPFRTMKGTIAFVINLYTQNLPGPNLDEEALLLGFKKLKHFLDIDAKIGIPLIGCGIAGGDWTEIEPKIAKIMENHDVTVVHYKKEKNGDKNKKSR